MHRAGGYRSYAPAYERELLLLARPLDESWAGAIEAGTHTATVGEVEVGADWLRLAFDLVGSKRVWVRLDENDWRTGQLLTVVGRTEVGGWSTLANRVLGTECSVGVVVDGQVDVLVCPDSTYIIVDRRGLIVCRCTEYKEVDEWLSTTNSTRRRARVTRISSTTR